MSAILEHQTGNIYQLRVIGELRKSDLDAVQSDFAQNLADAGSIRVLVLLESFTGCERGATWDDGGFYHCHGDDNERIAVVGDPRWEAETLAYSGAGMRKAPVRFFSGSDESEARSWLAE